MHPRSRPFWLLLALTLLLLVLLAAAYIAALAATVDVSRISDSRTANDRDLVYLGIHVGILLLALAGGYLFGRWANGLGAAFATLFFVVLVLWMLTAQIGSYAIACETKNGENDLIRHWEC